MKIRLEPVVSSGYPTVEIGCDNDDMTLKDVMETLIKPALLAWGFHSDNIDEFFEVERNEAVAELIYAVGKLVVEEDSQWRVEHAELMDAYKAVNES